MSDKIEFIRQNLKLTAEQWQMLHDLAEATNSLAPTGSKAFEPSWRTLVKRIADGEFILTPSKPSSVVKVRKKSRKEA